MKKYICVLILVIILISVGVATSKQKSNVFLIEEGQYNSEWRTWYQIIHDDKRNVTCWITTYGMSCVSDAQIYIVGVEGQRIPPDLSDG